MKTILQRHYIAFGTFLLLCVTAYFPASNDSTPLLAGLPLIGGIAAIGSSLLGKLSGDADRGQAAELIAQSVKELEEMGVPTVEAQQLLLEQFKSTGKLTPDLEQIITQGPSNFEDMQLDPRSREAQLKALDSLQNITERGGMDLQDEAALNKVRSAVATSDKGRRDAIMQRMDARGMGGSGFELASQLASVQDSAQRESDASLDVAAQARQRVLDSIMKSGELGGSMRAQEFSEAARKAEAMDAIDRFNTQSRQDVQTRNVGATNAAKQYNLTNDQRIADANTTLRNQQQQYNKELLQKDFNNRLSVNTAKANARAGQASNLNQAANESQQFWGGVGQGINSVASAYDASEKADKRWQGYMDAMKGRNAPTATPDQRKR